MTSIIRRPAFPARNISKREFLTPFDELFNNMIGDMFPTLHQEFGDDFFVQGSYPKCNVIANDKSIIIEAAIPGLDKNDVNVEIDNAILTIRGEANQHEGIRDEQYVKRELKRSAFQRSFKLDDNLDDSGITGAYDKGILTITIPKIIPSDTQEQIRKIEIK
tara:strand:- start:1020 stop:1505 length:486 start_codon:yes stop_codon:yes gene_type:complete